MRTLEFRDARDGDQLPADPGTIDGAAMCFAWLCPSLTEEEARRAAEEGARRLMPVSVAASKALLTEMFQ